MGNTKKMVNCSQIVPGMTVNMQGRIFRVESSVKVSVAKAAPFVKVVLRDLITDEVVEKNFKPTQELQEVSLIDHKLEYLYPEGKGFLFLDIEDLSQVLVPAEILSDKVSYLKEGTQVRALFYGETIFSIELPQFLELMVVKTDSGEEESLSVTQTTKLAVLETGARVEVPLFIDSGDVIKVDTHSHEYIQRL